MKKIQLGLRYFYNLFFSGFHHLGWKVEFGNNIILQNCKKISLGSYVRVNDLVSISAINEKELKEHKSNEPIIKIGNNVGIEKGTIIYGLWDIEIKEHTMIGPYSFIADYDHEYSDVTRPISQQKLTSKGPVFIDKGSWIGAHVTVCSGVKIGKNVVIGANSVVTKDIPDYSVAVGSPAKVIKNLYPTENNIQII